MSQAGVGTMRSAQRMKSCTENIKYITPSYYKRTLKSSKGQRSLEKKLHNKKQKNWLGQAMTTSAHYGKIDFSVDASTYSVKNVRR